MEIKDTAREKVEAQLSAWGAEIDKLRAKVDQEIAGAKKEYYEQIEKLRGEIEEQVKKWGPEITLQDLRARIEAELRAWAPEIETLKTKRKELTARVQKLKHASGSAWEDVKGGMGKAWEELKPALQSAIAKFK